MEAGPLGLVEAKPLRGTWPAGASFVKGHIPAAVLVSLVLHMAGIAWLANEVLFGRGAQANRDASEIHAQLSVSSSNAAPLALEVPVANSLVAPSLEKREARDPAQDIAENNSAVHADRMLPVRERAQRKTEIVSPFLPPEQVERAAYPLSAPDLRPLQLFVTEYSGMPIRLRLFVDSKGSVVDVKIIRALPTDEDAAALLVQIWERVGFVPARRQGAEVASYQDVEFELADRLGVPLVHLTPMDTP